METGQNDKCFEQGRLEFSLVIPNRDAVYSQHVHGFQASLEPVNHQHGRVGVM
jgi:hypothetical protein